MAHRLSILIEQRNGEQRCKEGAGKKGRLWLDVYGTSAKERVEKLGEKSGIHENKLALPIRNFDSKD